MKNIALIFLIALSAFFMMPYSSWATGDGWGGSAHIAHVPMIATTQGPFWPPSEVMDENGDFIVVGRLLEVPDGNDNYFPGGPRAAIVSRMTMPPLGPSGKEDFTNPFGAPYMVLRELDLRPGSDDLNLVLHSLSYGPLEDDSFSGGPRIPQEGDSLYNLNPFPPACPEIFPTMDNVEYRRDSFPLHQVPVWGFKGDQIRYDASTGEAMSLAELPLDQRRIEDPITLGLWLKAGRKSRMQVRLKDYDFHKKVYSAAQFKLRLRNLIPNSIYTAWAIRLINLNPIPGQPLPIPDPLCLPSVITTDKHGHGELECTVKNPFPSLAGPQALQRLMLIALSYQSGQQSWGACPSYFAEGVDNHVHLVTDPEAFSHFETQLGQN